MAERSKGPNLKPISLKMGVYPVSPHDAPLIEGVVVIVGYHHEVNRRQFRKGHSRRHYSPRSFPLEGRCALGEVGVGEDIFSANLEKHRGMADPCKGGFLSIESQKGGIILG